MNSTRACGCKSYRTCRICETELGLQPASTWQEELVRGADQYRILGCFSSERGSVKNVGDGVDGSYNMGTVAMNILIGSMPGVLALVWRQGLFMCAMLGLALT